MYVSWCVRCILILECCTVNKRNNLHITHLQDPLYSVLMKPKVVTDVEEEELRKQMEELQLANEEVAGDDDTSDQEAG